MKAKKECTVILYASCAWMFSHLFYLKFQEGFQFFLFHSIIKGFKILEGKDVELVYQAQGAQVLIAFYFKIMLL